jgi:hypothetical protein
MTHRYKGVGEFSLPAKRFVTFVFLCFQRYLQEDDSVYLPPEIPMLIMSFLNSADATKSRLGRRALASPDSRSDDPFA